MLRGGHVLQDRALPVEWTYTHRIACIANESADGSADGSAEDSADELADQSKLTIQDVPFCQGCQDGEKALHGQQMHSAQGAVDRERSLGQQG